MQNAIEQALTRIKAEPIGFAAAGRTDTGVHATGQVISFSTPHERATDAWQKGLNAHLPATIRILWVRRVVPEFHARFAATGRRYLYVFLEGDALPHLAARVTPTPVLDDGLMHHAAQCLLGEQDFSAFRAAACQSPTAYRRVDHAIVRRYGPLVVIDVAANAFLLRMMRNIAGGLAQVGRREWQPADFHKVLLSRDRTALGRTAAPHGLYLVDVRYPDQLLLNPDDQASGWPAGKLPPMLLHRHSLDRL